ncbi:MAG: hypothetical protein ND866_16520 [Pyrinomonadaceae bacterium]|nr:hypothetical protein [Pyrinomonadaceae bacterium]
MSKLSDHIDLVTIADLVENRVAPKLRTESMAHISNCSPCAEKLRKLGDVVRLMQTDRTEDAPRDVVAYAMSIFSGRAKSPGQSLKRRILAALSFDSMNQAPAFGLRSAQTGTRQLIYSAEENDIDLRITLHEDMWVVAGQVLREECAGGSVEIEGLSGSAAATLNDMCEFTLPGVPPGNYLLRVHMSDVEVELPQLELTA